MLKYLINEIAPKTYEFECKTNEKLIAPKYFLINKKILYLHGTNEITIIWLNTFQVFTLIKYNVKVK